MPVVRCFKPVAEIPLAVELLPRERCERFDRVHVIGVVTILKKAELPRQCRFQRGALRRGHTFQIERPLVLCGTRAKRFDRGSKLTPAGGIGVECPLRAKVFDAEAIAENGLLEWAQFAGARYGTPRKPVEDRVADGQPVLDELGIQLSIDIPSDAVHRLDELRKTGLKPLPGPRAPSNDKPDRPLAR